MTATTPLNYEA